MPSTKVKSTIPPTIPVCEKVLGIDRYEIPKNSLTVTMNSWKSDGALMFL